MDKQREQYVIVMMHSRALLSVIIVSS